MKILVVCQYYYPEQFRINDICEQFVTDGHSVTVLTGLPNYPSGQIPAEYKHGNKRQEVIKGVTVLRSFEIGRRTGIVGLALNYASYMFSASIRALFMQKKFDVIFVYQLSPVTMALPGVILKILSKRPLYLYCCDVWPESIKNLISNENALVYGAAKKISNYLYSQCDAIAVTSKPFIDYFHNVHNISPQRISYIPQHAEDIYSEVRESHDNKIVDFVFMGNIGIAQDIECILKAAVQMKNIPNFKIHFVGDGSYLDTCKSKVDLNGLQGVVVFHGRHSLDKMPEFYSFADACLLTLKGNNLIGQTIPSKLQGYMAAGKPVIGAINGAAQEIINESQCGICVDAGDYDGLAKCMIDFVENPGKYKECGPNGRAYFKKYFTKEIFMQKLENELRTLVEAKYNVL